MADEADKANDLADIEREAAIRGRVRIDVRPTDDCIDCGLQISSERQIATGGCNTCKECEDYREEVKRRKSGFFMY